MLYWNQDLKALSLIQKFYIGNYETLPFVRNPHGGGVRSDIRYKLTSFPPNEIENIIYATHETDQNWNYLRTLKSV